MYILFYYMTAVRIAEWDQCRYILLTAGRIDQRRPGTATLSINAAPCCGSLFEKRRIVHLGYIDTRRIREGSQSANNGTVDVLSWQPFLWTGKTYYSNVPCPRINARERFYARDCENLFLCYTSCRLSSRSAFLTWMPLQRAQKRSRALSRN